MTKSSLIILHCAILMISVSKCEVKDTFRYLVEDIEPEDVELTGPAEITKEQVHDPGTSSKIVQTELRGDSAFVDDKRILDSIDVTGKRCPPGKIRDRRGICRIVFRYKRSF